jgi:hypothetical protein
MLAQPRGALRGPFADRCPPGRGPLGFAPKDFVPPWRDPLDWEPPDLGFAGEDFP